jgi:hypothetical protein
MMLDKIKELWSKDFRDIKKSRWVTIEEADLILKLAKEADPDYIFESGTANGISALFLSTVGCPVYTFDPVARRKVWDIVTLPTDNITYVEDKFSSVAERYPELKDKKKVFFIDGSHSNTGIQEDCNALKEFAKEGDLILFHDLCIAPVMRAWMRLWRYGEDVERHETRRIIGSMIWK